MRDSQVLQNCLVEGNASAVARARKRRRYALLVSVLLEASGAVRDSTAPAVPCPERKSNSDASFRAQRNRTTFDHSRFDDPLPTTRDSAAR